MIMAKKLAHLSLAAVAAALIGFIALHVRSDIKGHFEGFYLLHDRQAGNYEFADHLFVGEGKSLIYGKDFSGPLQRFINRIIPAHDTGRNHLHTDWNPHDGCGMVSQHFADGTQLVTYFGRYLDALEEVHGLFVGGGLPDSVAANTNYNMNNSGMTFNDGNRWYHIWCSVNEGIVAQGDEEVQTPSHWRFLGSRVVSRSDNRVVISSSHALTLRGVPLTMERTATFAAGERYFTLKIALTNRGNLPLNYEYTYGDEPWVGYYGTSLGDVGWVADRLINYEEVVDSGKYHYAGMVDSGNRVIGERPVYTNLANFIEWFGPERPFVFLANQEHPPQPGSRIPLESNERFIGLAWDRQLQPGETTAILLAIGMATVNPRTGLPEKPPTTWK